MLGSDSPLIGLLTSSTVEPWATRQWDGVVDAARARGFRLVSFIGGVLSSSRYGGQASVMYDLAASARLDGLIVWSTAIGWMFPRDGLAEFLSRFGSTPLVSMEMRFDGRPSVLMDDYGGMRGAVDHLIEAHGRRRVAFIRGGGTHEGFAERYRAYRDSLEAHGLGFDPRLAPSPADELDGLAAMRAIIASGAPPPDALAGADDILVLSAIKALPEVGLRIPEDIAVAGFDNLPEDLAVSPTLSSADPPFFAMGRRAVGILADMIEGRPVPEVEILPVTFVRRRSCGCPGSLDQEGLSSSRSHPRRERQAPAEAEDGWAAVAACLRESEAAVSEAAVEGLWKLFSREIRGEGEGLFIPALEREIEKAVAAGAEPTRWLRLLVAIQRAIVPWVAAQGHDCQLRAGELWGRAQELSAISIQSQIARRSVSFGARHEALRRISERLGGISEVEEQMDIVAAHLSRLGLTGCCISLFSRLDDPTGEARLVLSYRNGERRPIPPGGVLFPAWELVPASEPFGAAGNSLLAQALYFGLECFGFVVYEISNKDDALLCEILRWQLSGALKSAADIRAEKAAAEEKAVLLRELQHRIKNSISVIASIAGIEAQAATHPEAKAAISSVRARISAVGDLYEELFDAGGTESVDMSDYLGRVLDSALASMGCDDGRIVVDRRVPSFRIDLKRAVSLGLIVNELVTDSLKHGFPDGRRGTISVAAVPDGDDLVFDIRDDGVGFPPGFDLAAAKGFGLRMVYLLAAQLDGKLEIDSEDGGVKASLRFRP